MAATADVTLPAPKREATPVDPLARVHANAALIHGILGRHFPDARWGAPEGLTSTAITIEQVARWARMWTPQRIGRARYEAARRKGAAIPPKHTQIWPPPPAAIEHARKKQRTGRETLAARQFREGLKTMLICNEQHSPVRVARPRLAPQGPLPTRWGLLLRGVAPAVAAAVAQHGGRVTTARTGAFTKVCRDLLAIILPNEKLPSISTLSDALKTVIVIDTDNSQTKGRK